MMSTRKLRFAIFGNVYQPKKSVSIQKILACLSQYEAEVFIEREFYTFITEGQQMSLKGAFLPQEAVSFRGMYLPDYYLNGYSRPQAALCSAENAE